MNLVVQEIKKSIDLMDKFVGGNYEYLELQNWYHVSNDNARPYDSFDVSLLISRRRDRGRELCEWSPTMTEFRKIDSHYIDPKWFHPHNPLETLVLEASAVWENNVHVKLPQQVRLRAQTSENRTDYGCEWIGGGDWVEKTLYGDTTDFYIDSIIMRNPHERDVRGDEWRMLIDQSIRDLKNKTARLKEIHRNNSEYLDYAAEIFTTTDQYVIHKKHGTGQVLEIKDTKMLVQYDNGAVLQYPFPGGLFRGLLTLPEMNRTVYETASRKWNENHELQAEMRKYGSAIYDRYSYDGKLLILKLNGASCYKNYVTKRIDSAYMDLQRGRLTRSQFDSVLELFKVDVPNNLEDEEFAVDWAEAD